MSKRTIALFILILGIAAAFVIVRLTSPSTDAENPLTFTSGGGDSSFAFEETTGGGASGINALRSLGENLTEQVVMRYGEEVLKLNVPGSSASTVTLPNESVLEAMIRDSLSIKFPIVPFTKSDLRVIPLTDGRSLLEYFSSIRNDYQKQFDTLTGDFLLAIAQTIETGDVRALHAYEQAATAYVGDLLALEVPTPAVSFHLMMTNLWNERVSAIQAVANYDNDPLRAVTALEHIETLADEEEKILDVFGALLREMKS